MQLSFLSLPSSSSSSCSCSGFDSSVSSNSNHSSSIYPSSFSSNSSHSSSMYPLSSLTLTIIPLFLPLDFLSHHSLFSSIYIVLSCLTSLSLYLCLSNSCQLPVKIENLAAMDEFQSLQDCRLILTVHVQSAIHLFQYPLSHASRMSSVLFLLR
eukprot:TRINITY_DN9441_c0_g2_i1.p1 TRINITY_DN9441_c0_g2~~TRINITY_DN9441_c0_g2_i1.p1  ORF type:complete len:154 (+),score=0.55 TRINITY_DN9441_c0_g2_i1:200-661(+)